MRRIVSSVVIALGLLLATGTGSAQAQGKGKPPAPQPVPVTSTVQNFAASGSMLNLQSDQSAAASYTGGAGILSQIYAESGDWVLDLQAQTARTVDLTFLPVGNPTSVPASGLYPARVLSRCFTGDDITGFLAVSPGTANSTCALRIGFTASDGTAYALVASPLYSGTTPAKVTCVAANTSGACSHWTIESTGQFDAQSALYRMSRSLKETYVGNFYFTYFIDVTR